MPLRFTVTNVSNVIIGRPSAGIVDAFTDFVYQLVQMGTSWMALSITAFNDDLWFAELFDAPAATETK